MQVVLDITNNFRSKPVFLTKNIDIRKFLKTSLGKNLDLTAIEFNFDRLSRVDKLTHTTYGKGSIEKIAFTRS